MKALSLSETRGHDNGSKSGNRDENPKPNRENSYPRIRVHAGTKGAETETDTNA